MGAEFLEFLEAFELLRECFDDRFRLHLEEDFLILAGL